MSHLQSQGNPAYLLRPSIYQTRQAPPIARQRSPTAVQPVHRYQSLAHWSPSGMPRPAQVPTAAIQLAAIGVQRYSNPLQWPPEAMQHSAPRAAPQDIRLPAAPVQSPANYLVNDTLPFPQAGASLNRAQYQPYQQVQHANPAYRPNLSQWSVAITSPPPGYGYRVSNSNNNNNNNNNNNGVQTNQHGWYPLPVVQKPFLINQHCSKHLYIAPTVWIRKSRKGQFPEGAPTTLATFSLEYDCDGNPSEYDVFQCVLAYELSGLEHAELMICDARAKPEAKEHQARDNKAAFIKGTLVQNDGIHLIRNEVVNGRRVIEGFIEARFITEVKIGAYTFKKNCQKIRLRLHVRLAQNNMVYHDVILSDAFQVGKWSSRERDESSGTNTGTLASTQRLVASLQTALTRYQQENRANFQAATSTSPDELMRQINRAVRSTPSVSTVHDESFNTSETSSVACRTSDNSVDYML